MKGQFDTLPIYSLPDGRAYSILDLGTQTQARKGYWNTLISAARLEDQVLHRGFADDQVGAQTLLEAMTFYDHYFAAVTEEDQVLGVFGLELMPDYASCEVNSILPDCEGQGVQLALADICVRVCEERRIPQLRLSVSLADEEERRDFKRCGFVPVGEPDEDGCVLLVKEF